MNRRGGWITCLLFPMRSCEWFDLVRCELREYPKSKLRSMRYCLCGATFNDHLKVESRRRKTLMSNSLPGLQRRPRGDPVTVKAEELRPWKSTAATPEEQLVREMAVHFCPLLQKATGSHCNYPSLENEHDDEHKKDKSIMRTD